MAAVGSTRRSWRACTVALVLAGLPAAVGAQKACDAPAFHQFDFWLGDWTVDQEILQRDGTYAHYPAVDRVERAVDGCAVVEHWRGIVQFFWDDMTAPDSLYGFSVRSFDPAHGTWSVLWLSSRHAALTQPFTGAFAAGRGTFTKRVPQADGTTSISRIVFAPVHADTVEWSLATSSDGGATWRAVWRMHFHRPSQPGARPTATGAPRAAREPAPPPPPPPRATAVRPQR